jgi:hypothetical protein
MRNCVIIGSGRSGTSMLAGLLYSSGYSLGKDLLPPTPSNPKGYFESHSINELNNDLLKSAITTRPLGPIGILFPGRLPLGLLWLADIDFPAQIDVSDSHLDRMRSLIPDKPFCLKDPRFCYTLGAWLPILDQNDVIFLCIFREPGRTASSMKTDVHERAYKDFYLTRRRALSSWVSMYEHVLRKYSLHGRWLFAHYDQILDGSVISSIEDALDTKIDTSFVDSELKRSRDSSRASGRVLQIYQDLCARANYNISSQ